MFVAGVFRLLDVDRVPVLWLPRGLQERESRHKGKADLLGSILSNYFCRNLTAIKLCQYFDLISEIFNEFSCVHICACHYGLGHFHLDGANLRMQTHLASKIMHHNFMAIQLWQKNSFIVLVPVVFA